MRSVVAFCFRNKLLKLLSLGMAVVIWFYVNQRSSNTQDVPDVGIVFRSTKDNFIMVTSPSRINRLSLNVPAFLAERLETAGITAEIDLEQKERTKQVKLPDRSKDHSTVSLSVPITSSDIRNLPSNVTVSRIEPGFVSVVLDPIIQKQLTVVLDRDMSDYAKEIRKGFRIHKIYITPLRVTVSGPKTVLERRETIRIRPLPDGTLDAADWKPEFARDVEVDLDTSDEITGLKECLSPLPPRVKVWVQAVPIANELVRKDVPLTVNGLPGFCYILLNETKTNILTHIPEVRLRSDEKLLVESGLRAYVDLTDITNPKASPEVTRDVRFTCAPEVEILTPAPKVVVQIKQIRQE